MSITLEAGGREQLKTCNGGLLAANNSGILCRVKDVLIFRITSDDLLVLADSLAKREDDFPKPQENNGKTRKA